MYQNLWIYSLKKIASEDDFENHEQANLYSGLNVWNNSSE